MTANSVDVTIDVHSFANVDSQKVDHFMRMQLRMLEIRNEIEMLENPVIRRTFEDVHFKVKSNNKFDQKSNIHVVTMVDTINKQMAYFDTVKRMIDTDGMGSEIVKFTPSLMVCTTLNMRF